MANALFYLMAALTIASALGVITARNPIASVLSLLASFFALATIYLLAGFQFIAATQILVYAGAIMVLFLFVIMLLNLADVRQLASFPRQFLARGQPWVAAGVALALLVVSSAAVSFGSGVEAAATPTPAAGIDGIADSEQGPGLASAMFGRYLLPFEAVSILLLATAVAVVVLAKRQRAPLRAERGQGAQGGGA